MTSRWGKSFSWDQQNIFTKINIYPASTVTSCAPFPASCHRCTAPRIDSRSRPCSGRFLCPESCEKQFSLLMKQFRNKAKEFFIFSHNKQRSAEGQSTFGSRKHRAYWSGSNSSCASISTFSRLITWGADRSARSIQSLRAINRPVNHYVSHFTWFSKQAIFAADDRLVFIGTRRALINKFYVALSNSSQLSLRRRDWLSVYSTLAYF